MFFYLAQFKDQISFLNLFRYITFRTGMAAVTTFLMCLVFGPYLINKLKRMNIGENTKREDCPVLDQFNDAKEGTPTMGGIFIVGSILVSVFLWADLSNVYIRLCAFTCLWLAVLGWADDYVKLLRKPKKGISKKTKLIWQIMIGCFIGSYVYFSPDISTKLAVPFLKHVVIDLGIFYIPFVALIIVGTSNAVNLTDGLDGLAIGCVLVFTVTLAILCYITGNINFSEYLLLPFVSGSGELTVFCAAIIGASLGFLWFNCYPASVFMGDVGSLSLGGTVGVIAVIIKKELLIVILGGVFVIEVGSVILQVISFKIWNRRIFKVSPLHHHLQLSGWKESKIIIRFWILAIILAFITLTTLKIR
ncbi:MAG: phospho-N-acetylmuramoyl-pentapeptide-transferase [Omnitrophica WOR_2 bacterium RIFOXYB2_FULL_38_16]|nr:MAG: phospho-N-acetylmuramoyl-pentapeptide-transferase [Omnitrophica WOR_2 bacterium RIFOXYA2_FULL_38_17]OGX56103.1 MAG: phospho-N-acetylmuramoyl-pentapeptide-transferase [Omnitrophica WOR_2 bacterium RIFOXYC2_FULL_38_12]OGX60461.1 MAG: phospho-N-acetylmuramoyl-pentapeptide-transferase [Omnitrophica WOR_2 bacterium RIFOXYB2_FULL_38_16]HBG60861.1 phospho-N-acetylmuramoyl-pentapeptide-transferase [Candidatus Omnitrophota bacterium]